VSGAAGDGEAITCEYNSGGGVRCRPASPCEGCERSADATLRLPYRGDSDPADYPSRRGDVSAYKLATDILLGGPSEMARALAERDQVIDALYPEIEDLANKELLLQAPVASDLRLLVSVLRVVPELERSHDLVVDIARRASHLLSEDLTPRTRTLVGQMGNLAADMWRQAVDCWRQRDRSAAVALSERDNEMKELYAGLTAEIASGRMTVPVTMEMTLVGRFYERLADHAFNIARRVVYLAGSAHS
jgi:phosphate transport system protein